MRDFDKQGTAIISKVFHVRPIPGSKLDALALKTGPHDGWRVVCGRGEHNVGDIGVYVPEGQVVPDSWDFGWLNGRTRIQKRRMLGEISTGIFVPISVIPLCVRYLPVFTNVAGAIGVFPYKPGKPGRSYRMSEKGVEAMIRYYEETGAVFANGLPVGPGGNLDKTDYKMLRSNADAVAKFFERREAMIDQEWFLSARADETNAANEESESEKAYRKYRKDQEDGLADTNPDPEVLAKHEAAMVNLGLFKPKQIVLTADEKILIVQLAKRIVDNG